MKRCCASITETTDALSPQALEYALHLLYLVQTRVASSNTELDQYTLESLVSLLSVDNHPQFTARAARILETVIGAQQTAHPLFTSLNVFDIVAQRLASVTEKCTLATIGALSETSALEEAQKPLENHGDALAMSNSDSDSFPQQHQQHHLPPLPVSSSSSLSSSSVSLAPPSTTPDEALEHVAPMLDDHAGSHAAAQLVDNLQLRDL